MVLASRGWNQSSYRATYLASATCASILALERLALVFAQTAPNTGVLVFFDCVLEALARDSALTTNCLGLFDLLCRRAGVTNWEEEFWVFGKASRLIQPLHIHA